MRDTFGLPAGEGRSAVQGHWNNLKLRSICSYADLLDKFKVDHSSTTARLLLWQGTAPQNGSESEEPPVTTPPSVPAGLSTPNVPAGLSTPSLNSAFVQVAFSVDHLGLRAQHPIRSNANYPHLECSHLRGIV